AAQHAGRDGTRRSRVVFRLSPSERSRAASRWREVRVPSRTRRVAAQHARRGGTRRSRVARRSGGGRPSAWLKAHRLHLPQPAQGALEGEGQGPFGVQLIQRHLRFDIQRYATVVAFIHQGYQPAHAVILARQRRQHAVAGSDLLGGILGSPGDAHLPGRSAQARYAAQQYRWIPVTQGDEIQRSQWPFTQISEVEPGRRGAVAFWLQLLMVHFDR